MSRGTKRSNFGATTQSPIPAPPSTSEPAASQKVDRDSKETSNGSQKTPRDFFTVALANGGEVGVRPSAVLWYQSTSKPDMTEVGMSDGKVLEVPIDVRRFASRLRNLK